MSLITITSTTKPFTAKLSLNLRPYCEAYARFIADPGNKSLSNNFKHLRTTIGTQLIGLDGALHWPQIKALWTKEPVGKKTFPFLYSNDTERSSSDTERAPLVIDTLDRFFIELLKNSIDAILKNYLDNKETPTTLEMSIELVMETPELISVVIQDNSGGFATSYLRNFPSYISNREYQKHTISGEENASSFGSKKDNNNYYFGGAGKGLAIILNLLLTGHLLEGAEQLKPLYQVEGK